MQTIYCRKAPSIGELESDPFSIWGTPEYEGDTDSPCVFFGLYGLADFYSLWRHKGKKYILWAGTDITHFVKGYWLDDKGKIKLDVSALSQWIQENCESWVENKVEYDALFYEGIKSSICPSFLGDVNNFPVSYTHSDRPKLYTSVSGDNFNLYGWNRILPLAFDNKNVEFHLYGNTIDVPYQFPSNVIVHGRVPKEQMNEEIKSMQGALRLAEADGFSEILAKSVLMGQYPVSIISYHYMLNLYGIGSLKTKKEPNIEGKEYYLKILNDYPWNMKKHV